MYCAALSAARIRHGYKLGQKTPFFQQAWSADLSGRNGCGLSGTVGKTPRVSTDTLLRLEEERFYETHRQWHGDSRRRAGRDVQRRPEDLLDGETAFKPCYDTYRLSRSI